MCSFEHNFPLFHPMRSVFTKLYQLRDVTTCKFSLKRRISALVWVTWTPPCADTRHIRRSNRKLCLKLHTDMGSCVKSWIQRRVRKIKSCGGTSFRLQMWVVRWKRWCYMFNDTHRHVFISQKVCRHSFCSVRTCAWTRLVDDTFVWKRGSRD